MWMDVSEEVVHEELYRPRYSLSQPKLTYFKTKSIIIAGTEQSFRKCVDAFELGAISSRTHSSKVITV